MSDKQQPIRIKGWETGIADSAYKGNGLLRNVEVESFSGAVKVSKLPVSQFVALNLVTFTADPSTDLCTASNVVGGFYSGSAVYFTTTGTLPAGLSLNTVYFLYKVTEDTFKVCTSYKNSAGSAAGTVINITDAGTGVHTLHQVAIGTINHIIKEPISQRKFALDSNGRVWFESSGNSNYYLLLHSSIENPSGGLTASFGAGMIVNSFSSTTNTWLFVFRGNTIDVISVAGTAAIETPAWLDAWASLNASAGVETSHHVIKGQDDALYWCDDQYIGSLIENVGFTFDPSNASTFTYNSQALDLPTFEIAQCLEELGTNLLIGGNRFNKIYPWDRISSSFDMPIPVPENSIKKMLNIGGIVYILAGTWGNIYKTQGTYVTLFKKLPTYVINNSYSLLSNPITWGGIAQINSALLFGVAGTTSGSSGVYRLYENGVLVHDNTPSTGSKNATALYAIDEFYDMGYNGGADTISTAQYGTSTFSAILHSELYRVGTKVSKASFSYIEIQVARPMSAGTIRISYRTNTSASFTTLDTYTSNASTTSFMTDIGLTDLENIQIQAEIDGNIELLEIILYP